MEILLLKFRYSKLLFLIKSIIIFGPYFFTKNNFDGSDFVHMLDIWFIPYICNFNIAYFMQHEALSHWSIAYSYPFNPFPSQCSFSLPVIGRASTKLPVCCTGHIAYWPPRYPNLTPQDFSGDTFIEWIEDNNWVCHKILAFPHNKNLRWRY